MLLKCTTVIILVELLATSIRENKNIKGIIVDNTTYKISQLADDTTLFIKAQVSLKHAFDQIERFWDLLWTQAK